MNSTRYALGYSAEEARRLEVQAALSDDILEDGLRRGAQELAQRERVLHDRRAQRRGVEPELGACRVEAQVLRKHRGVLAGMRGPRIGELGAQDRDAMARQPAHQAVDHYEQSLDGKARVGRWADPVRQHDDGVPIVRKYSELT